MTYVITYETNPHHDDVDVLGKGISDHAKEQKGHDPIETFAFFVRDDENKVKGGCNGVMYYGCLYVDQLWMNQALRGKGYGKELVLRAEKLAKEKKCTFATVNTMDREALDFYKKLGYHVEHERHGFHKGSVFYFLRKDL